MRYLSLLIRCTTWLNDRLGRWAISYMAFAIFLLLLYEMTARYVFRAPTTWATELAQMLFGAYAVLSGGYLLVQGGHVNVDIFHRRLPARARAAVDVLTSVLFFAFLLVLLKEGWNMAYESLEQMESSYSAWNPPVWPLKLMIPVGAALLFLQGLAKLIDDIVDLIDPSRERKPEGKAGATS